MQLIKLVFLDYQIKLNQIKEYSEVCSLPVFQIFVIWFWIPVKIIEIKACVRILKDRICTSKNTRTTSRSLGPFPHTTSETYE